MEMLEDSTMTYINGKYENVNFPLDLILFCSRFELKVAQRKNTIAGKNMKNPLAGWFEVH